MAIVAQVEGGAEGRDARKPRRLRLFLDRGLCLALPIVLAACAGTPRVTRTSSDEVVDLSGHWNDTDSQLVSQEMIDDSLARAWIESWRSENRGAPTVIVGPVRNMSSEHINTRTFTKDLERAFVNSGRVRLVAASDERGALRDERLDQLQHATLETAKSMGKEIGADFMLIGGINTIIDSAGRTDVRYYQVELELIRLETNEKVWIGQKKIKKIVERPRFRL